MDILVTLIENVRSVGFSNVTYFISTLFLMLLSWYLINQYNRNRSLPPGPVGLPYLGVAPYLYGRDQATVFGEWATRYGDVVCVRLLGECFVILNSAEVAREAFSREEFSGRPSSFFFDHMMKNRGITGTEGSVWRVLKRFELATLREFGMGKAKMERAVQEELNCLKTAIDQQNGQPFYLSKLLLPAICNVINSTLFAKRFDYDDPKLQALIKLMSYIMGKVFGLSNTLSPLPWLRHLPGDVFDYWKTLAQSDAVDDYLLEEIEIHKRTYQPDVTRDFVDMFLKRMEENKNVKNSPFTDDHLLKACYELFIAGVDTTLNTLNWTFLYLLNYPEIQTKLHKDINDVMTVNETPSMQHRPQLPYVEATIHETMRASRVVPGGLPHSNTEETYLSGYRIPKRSVIIANLAGIHGDLRYWEDPDQFNPSRFLSDDGNIAKREGFIPFAVGRRSCSGESLARMEMFLFLAGLLQAFTFSPEVDDVLPTTDWLYGLVVSPTPYKVRAQRRNMIK